MKSIFTLLIFISLSFISVLGDDLDAFNDLDGFEMQDIQSDTQITSTDEKSKERNQIFSLSGNVALKTSYAYKKHRVKARNSDTIGINYEGFTQAQVALFLQLDTKLSEEWKLRISGDAFYDAYYELNRANNYNQDTLKAYETQLRFDDTYIQGRLSKNIDVKIGRQIVVWGKSDNIRVTDVINPLDNRLPAITDIEDLRLSTSMAKLDYYFDEWNFSAMAIFENRIFLEATPRSEFFPVAEIFPIAPDPFITLNQPKKTLQNMQYAFAANGVFSGWDLSFYGANVFNSKWHIEGTLPKASREVAKINMLGSAFNLVKGSWLLKSEVAYLNGIRYNATQDEKDRVDILIGFEYMGLSDTVLSLELVNRHIFEYETQMSGVNQGVVPDYTEQNEVQTAIRATRSFSNDTINATVLISMYGHNWQYGGFARIWVEYEVMNAINANIGLVDYITGDRPFFNSIQNNDRIFADITYSF